MGDGRVVCVIVNWNNAGDTIGCLESLAGQDFSGLDLIVVDNGSTDGSAEEIAGAFPWVELVRGGENRGFAAGCNVGIRKALERGAGYVWLLNNDTVAPGDTASRLMEAMERDARNGVVGSVLLSSLNPRVVDAWGGGTLVPWSGFVRHATEAFVPGDDAFLTFASVLIRCSVFREVGLLDERFFMYYEDTEFCFRARRAGWRLAVAGETAIWHKVNGSASAASRLWRVKTVTASGLRFLSLFGRPRGGSMGVFVGLRVGKRLARLDFAGVRAVMEGVAAFRRGGG